jgi:hypothetical protein
MSPEFMRKAGMVRASFGLYSTLEDVQSLITALKYIINHADEFEKQYKINDENDYQHLTYGLKADDIFSIESALDDYLS